MKKTLLQYLTDISFVTANNIFQSPDISFEFISDIKKYGLIAFEKLPPENQEQLLFNYYSIYR